MGTDYVHGYTPAETRRLTDQAGTLADLLHGGTTYLPGSRVLEAGCGVGAQTVQLVTRNPGIELVSIDISEESLAQAKARVAEHAPDATVDWRHADLHDLPDEKFDHVFVCFVLEHLVDPVIALTRLRGLLKPGGTITVIEGDHGSAFFHPRSPRAQAVVDCLVDLQAAAGGDSLIGRRLQPLLAQAGYDDVQVGPRTVYADESLPHLVDGFTRKTFIAMVGSVRERAIAAGLRTEGEWDAGIRDLERSAEPGGTFHYTFFKAVGLIYNDWQTNSGHRGCLPVPRLLRGTRHGISPHGTEDHDAPHRDLRPRTPSYRTEHLLAMTWNRQTTPRS